MSPLTLINSFALQHPGNMEFRDEARKMRVNYRDDDTSRREKFLLSQVSSASLLYFTLIPTATAFKADRFCFFDQELLGRVKEYGGRFLEKGTDNLWHEMSEKDARKKCSQGKLLSVSCLCYLVQRIITR